MVTSVLLFTFGAIVLFLFAMKRNFEALAFNRRAFNTDQIKPESQIAIETLNERLDRLLQSTHTFIGADVNSSQLAELLLPSLKPQIKRMIEEQVIESSVRISNELRTEINYIKDLIQKDLLEDKNTQRSLGNLYTVSSSWSAKDENLIDTLYMNIFVITYDGPEWSSPVEAHESPKKAKERCDELNVALKHKKNKDVFESLSYYAIKTVPFIPQR